MDFFRGLTMDNKHIFRFKQFQIAQQDCAMKVGTDGILLGAWAEISGATRLLDLGTGTGLIALMLAQRCQQQQIADFYIQGIEIDEAAYFQAKHNILSSPWSDKIKIYHQDIAEFNQTNRLKFDVVVANPPYFKPSLPCGSMQRELARYTLGNTHADWLDIAENCLSEQGVIHFILPFEEGEILQKQTALYCIKRCEVITKQGKAPQRLLLSFSQNFKALQQSQILIYDEKNQYSQEFIQLTKEFYLKF